MLIVDKITKYYGDFKAVDNLSFKVKEGEIFGLLGVNGAGKTTTFRMIMGLLEPTSGSITLDGKKIDYSITDKIGFLTEERSLLLKMTVKEQCLFYGTLKGMSENDILTKLDTLLNRFNISEYKDKKIKELSKGNQQKVQFITAIINDPKLLILDEPFSGLDPINIELFCKKIVVMLRGKAVLDGYISDIKEQYRKKNILVKAEIKKDVLEGIDGVLSVTEKADEFEVKIENSSVVDNVFKVVSKCKCVTKFVVEEPSLNEIFVERVGENYEK